ncbi:hypothetical protein [Variovorax sp. J22R115]|uniref:hypothetical protein n=1 Tax=Variovorax sp. J22R115 TaxID=3053509 RepID=UPI002576AA94|nr:hypothetical protein [Variovorax sp. J22R115]MDM0052932.1 hypothetical protein [Variovorax sp. J22R115]
MNPLLLSNRFVQAGADQVRNGLARPRIEPWLELSNTPNRYLPTDVNLNGIVASPDGRQCLTIQLVAGQLWCIDTQTRAVAEVRMESGDLKNRGGLVLTGAAERNIMRTAAHDVARVRLAPGWAAGPDRKAPHRPAPAPIRPQRRSRAD